MTTSATPGDSVPDFQRRMEGAVEWCRKMAETTENPVYVWMALNYRAWGDQRHLRPADEAPPDLVIPGWCAAYFADVAQELTFLAGGCDPRRDLSEDGERIEIAPGWTPPLLSEDEAMSLVTMVLGFTRRGYNAFKDYQSKLDSMKAFRDFQELRDGGLTHAQALRALAESGRAADDSVIRRRVTSGRRLVLGDRPEDTVPGDKGKT
jgi:hypothetical protein